MFDQSKFSARRAIVAAGSIALLAAAIGLAPKAMAQGAFPNKPVRIVVPFVAGGTTDIVARLVAARLSQVWGQSVVVENRGGAGGNIGAEAVVKSAPDGYTILMASGSIVTVNPHIYKKMPFDAKKDLIPVTNVASGPQLLVVANSVPAKNLKEFIALAKSQPGKLNFGSAGIGSQVHMAGESFLFAAGIEAQHIPYKGEAAAYTDLAANQVQFVVGNIAAASGHVTAGRARALGVTSAKRSPMMPEVPTLAEAGLAGFENTGWFGFMVPAGTPKAIVDKIYQDTAKILSETDIKARLFVQGMSPVGNNPADFAKEIDAEFDRWAKIVAGRKIQSN